MTDTARYKTIATIAVAFSLGTITTAACGGGPLAAANTKQLEADIADLQDEIADIKCVLTYLEDPDQNGNTRGQVDESEIAKANQACGL